jgi:hypothetical protein
MRKTLEEIETHVFAALSGKVHPDIATLAAARCAWLHGAGYDGLKYVGEALADMETNALLEKDVMGLDLHGVSCVYVAHQVEAQFAEHGRLFLRNVRHGLFLLQGSVEGNYGIGCPVDPAFALGGERSKNPYAEKLEIARNNGVEIDDASWNALVV